MRAFRSCCARTKRFIFLYRDSRHSPPTSVDALRHYGLALLLCRCLARLNSCHCRRICFRCCFELCLGCSDARCYARSACAFSCAASTQRGRLQQITRGSARTGSWSRRHLYQRALAGCTLAQLRFFFGNAVTNAHVAPRVPIVGAFSPTAHPSSGESHLPPLRQH